MTKTINKLESLLQKGIDYASKTSDDHLRLKRSPEKWSKKEILGHLIDSAINNLQRFTEIQFARKPYKIRNYDQNELVKVNDYQNTSLEELTNFWLAINTRILSIISHQTEQTLNYKIVIDDGEVTDLRFLIKDYVDHLEHHLIQILA